MSESADWTLHVDGAARGNPGPAAFAFVIMHQGKTVVEEKGCLGSATNNVAEYTALVRALDSAARLGAERLLVHSDSELLVKQMNGEYRVKNEGLRPLFEEAQKLRQGFRHCFIRHVPREQNHRADQLCNEALDGAGSASPKRSAGASSSSAGPSRKSRSSPALPSVETSAREEALTCLRSAAEHWALGKADNPPPELVWDQLWSILEEYGVLRKPQSR